LSFPSFLKTVFDHTHVRYRVGYGYQPCRSVPARHDDAYPGSSFTDGFDDLSLIEKSLSDGGAYFIENDKIVSA
jgi:hypothetical protein